MSTFYKKRRLTKMVSLLSLGNNSYFGETEIFKHDKLRTMCATVTSVTATILKIEKKVLLN